MKKQRKKLLLRETSKKDYYSRHMKKVLLFFLLTTVIPPASAQQMLSLDSCRAMALRNNKQLSVSRLKQEVATNTRKAVRTKYLPKVDAIGGYELLSKEISLLNNQQKSSLDNIGTTVVTNASAKLPEAITNMAQQGLITPQQAQAFGQMASQFSGPMAEALNGVGTEIRKAFRTNNRNMFGAAIMVQQPLYMGGAITAANRMADLNEELSTTSIKGTIQNTLYDVDNTYWLVVSLKQKNKLANGFLELIKKLDSDVQKMIEEGVATRADGLKVSVKVNEAEMAVTQAEDGLALAKMLLCQQCGLPIDSNITLEDENKEELTAVCDMTDGDIETALVNRYELEMLGKAVDISKESTRLLRAAYLPQVALTGGYLVTNPSVYNGFEHKFGGVWNIGILIRVPVWSWQEGTYKIRASKAATNIANMELAEATELIELQVNQSQFKMREANKKYGMSLKNVEKAEENLRCANLGFAEGVMTATEVMEAQTAWLQAQTQKIDAEIDLRLSQIGMKKALGVLQ